MSKLIWKYTLEPGPTVIEVPINARILDVQTQHEDPQLWLLVDPTNEKVKREFTIYDTGFTMPDYPGEYVGTFQLNGGGLVFHVFETTSIMEKK